MAMSECAKEAVYLQRFVRELGFSDLANLFVHCDNQSSLKLAENPTYHSRSKHIDIKHHFVREMIQDKSFNLKYVPTNNQIADFLTKGLTKIKHDWCTTSAGLKVIN